MNRVRCLNHGGSWRAREERESLGFKRLQKTAAPATFSSLCTEISFNEQLHVPSGDPRCHESSSISVPFHPALLLQTWHSLFLHSSEGEHRTVASTFPPLRSNAEFTLVGASI